MLATADEMNAHDSGLLPAFSAALEHGRLPYAALLKAASGTLLGPLAPRLPAPPLLGFDEVWDVKSTGGDHGMGSARAAVSLQRLAWAFACHFEGDPILPATLIIDALLQLAGLWGAARGLEGRGRATRVKDIRLTAEVTPRQDRLDYAISIRQFSMARGIVVADGLASTGGDPCVRVSGMMVAVVQHAASHRPKDAG